MQLQWPKFGQYCETSGKSGEAPDMPEVQELVDLYRAWRASATSEERSRIWHRMLEIHAEQQFTIGVITGVPQPVVVRKTLMNVPEQGLYNWDPGAFFGMYHPDTFWFTIGQTPHAPLHVPARADHDPDAARDQLRHLRHHPAAAGGLPLQPDRRAAKPGRQGGGREGEFLRKQYGLDKPFLEQYGIWIGVWPGERGFSGLLQGDFGWSFEYDMPVKNVVGDRLVLSVILNFSVILFTWAVAFPIGVYAATHQYSWGDHGLTFLGYLGLATPNFLLALVLMYFANVQFGAVDRRHHGPGVPRPALELGQGRARCSSTCGSR